MSDTSLQDRYIDLVEEATDTFLPEEYADNSEFRSILKVTFLRIVAVYANYEKEPFEEHPGDEYILGNLLSMIRNPQCVSEWVGQHTDHDGMSELEFQKHGEDLYQVLVEYYGSGQEDLPFATFIPERLVSPSGDVDVEELRDYYPGDGRYDD